MSTSATIDAATTVGMSVKIEDDGAVISMTIRLGNDTVYAIDDNSVWTSARMQRCRHIDSPVYGDLWIDSHRDLTEEEVTEIMYVYETAIHNAITKRETPCSELFL